MFFLSTAVSLQGYLPSASEHGSGKFFAFSYFTSCCDGYQLDNTRYEVWDWLFDHFSKIPKFPEFPNFPEYPKFPEFPNFLEYPKYPEFPKFPKFPMFPKFLSPWVP
jgi:hypothetical protein